jgi:hypothetical protein
MFADVALAARIERAECRLIADSAAALSHRRQGSSVYVRPMAGGIAFCAEPGSPLNKVAGLGFAGPIDARELAEVERAFAERGVPVQVELSTLAEAGTAALFTGRGYSLVGFENVLGRRVSAEDVVPGEKHGPGASVEVAPSGLEELPVWLDVVVTGFAHADEQGVPSHESFPREALERVVGDMARVEGVRRYLARRGGVPAGGASMRTCDGICGLHGAATLPEHRGHGVQTAMLERRLADAALAGCDVAVVTTQPGSKSQQNVQRLGFALLYARAILVL